MEEILKVIALPLFVFFIVVWFYVWSKTSYKEENNKIDSVLETLLKKENLNEVIGISFNQLQPENNVKILVVKKVDTIETYIKIAYVIEIYKYDRFHQPNKSLFEHYYTGDISFMLDEIKRISDKHNIKLFNCYN